MVGASGSIGAVAAGDRATGLSVFVCYRREDTAGFARALKTVLGERYGKDRVFMDLDSIAPGERWEAVVNRAVSGCDALDRVDRAALAHDQRRRWQSSVGEP